MDANCFGNKVPRATLCGERPVISNTCYIEIYRRRIPFAYYFDTMYKVMARSNWVIQELLKKGKSTTLSDIEREVSVKLTSLVDGLIS